MAISTLYDDQDDPVALIEHVARELQKLRARHFGLRDKTPFYIWMLRNGMIRIEIGDGGRQRREYDFDPADGAERIFKRVLLLM